MGMSEDRALEQAVAEAKSVRERIVEQVRFAEGLAELHPGEAGGWKPLIERAHDRYRVAARAGDLGGLEAVACDVEKTLAPIGEVAKTYTLRCVGHAHIDMNWMWSWPETVAVCNDTFITALKLMEEFPDFCLTQSQGVIYDIVRRYNPELFEQIKRRIAEGRWEIPAAAWVEADKNLSSGESLARHLLYTRQFTQEHLGLGADELFIEWEPDTFGHAQTIPAIVSRGGVKCYYLCRPGEQPTPMVFWYQSPDGSRILVNRETDWYNNTMGPHGARKLLAFAKETGLREWMYVYGVGDHGGGPTRRDLRRRAEMDAWPIYPRLQFSTSRPFFQRLLEHGDRWPTLTRELNFEFAGCYTSQSSIKKANRAGENLMGEAEVAAVLAERVTGRAYPAQQIKDAWKNVLFSQFHDILPGSGVRATREYAMAMFQDVQAAAGMIKTHSLRALAEKVDTSFARAEGERIEPPPALESRAFGAGAGRVTTATRPGGAWLLTDNQQVSSAAHVNDGPRPVVIFNPCAWKRREVVTVTVWEGEADHAGRKFKDRKFAVRLADGTVLPAQQVRDGGYWDHDFVDLAVPVEVEALGYSTIAIEEVPEQAPSSNPNRSWVEGQGDGKLKEGTVRSITEREGGWGINLPQGRWAMENDHLVVEFDRKTGGVSKLLDRATGQDLAKADDPMGLLELVIERPQFMSSWIIGDPGQRMFPIQLESFRPVLNGPWVASFEAKMRIRSSEFTVTYSLHAGRRQLEIDIAGRWVEIGGPEVGVPRLMIRFPLNVEQAKARYEIPFGSIEREINTGREVPALRWVDVKSEARGGKAGVALLNDSKYGHSLDGSVLRQTLIRSSYEPDPLPEMGEHRIRVAVAPHDAKTPVGELVRMGAGYNHLMIPVNASVHAGELPAVSDAVLACDAPNVVLSGIKRAEDGDGVIVRLYETAGAAATAQVRVNEQVMGKVASCERVDLLERAEGGDAVKVEKGALGVKVGAYEIVSLRVRVEGQGR